jgi:hypothetical protein
MTWIMTPRLRAALPEGVQNEPWHSQEIADSLARIARVPGGGLLDDIRADHVAAMTADRTDVEHVASLIEYFGVEHLSTTTRWPASTRTSSACNAALGRRSRPQAGRLYRMAVLPKGSTPVVRDAGYSSSSKKSSSTDLSS